MSYLLLILVIALLVYVAYVYLSLPEHERSPAKAWAALVAAAAIAAEYLGKYVSKAVDYLAGLF